MATTPDHFDTIVVGSGFGGSVTAYRLAESGQAVCVLERGKPYPPNSFARRPREMATNFWDPSKGLHGMFDVWSFRGIEGLVSSGLGGGSLIYANVLLRKDERWFTQETPGGGYEQWPVSRADLDPHYDVVERMLGGQPYPFDSPGYQDTAKTLAMRDAGQKLGLEWGLPNLAVSFANPGSPPRTAEPIDEGPYPNIHGRLRTTCRLCGECDIGCNYGSKNTLDHTYLSAAKHHGADIRTRCEVRTFGPRPGGGFTVTYVEHLREQEGTPTKTANLPGRTITADRLVLSAGTFGSTYLLLRNRANFPHISPALGTRFCGNGDLLGFLLNSHSGPAANPARRVLDGSRGPVITSFVRVPDGVDPGGTGQGAYIEDAGWPNLVDWLVETTNVPSGVRRALRFALRRIWARITHDPVSELSAQAGDLIGSASLSSGSLPLLGMGRDVPDGVMKLRKGYLDVDWTMATSKPYFDRVRQTMIAMADALGATYCDNPLSTLKRVITVHPLGGCPMATTEHDGVVDGYLQAFGYPGFYIADGSVMPGPVGPNPALTIAALADRMAQRIIDDARAVRTPGHEGDAPVDLPPTPAPSTPPLPTATGTDPDGAGFTSVEFTEEMKGFVTLGATDHEAGEKQGKADGTACMFHLTITTGDVERFVADPAHAGSAQGWVECEVLGGRLAVRNGLFNLFVASDDPDLTHMLYRLWFTDSVGNDLTLAGYKNVKDDPGFDLWSDTSTLYTRILAGHVEADGDDTATVVAAGILHIHLMDFARQLTTFRAHGPTHGARARGLAKFGRLFLGDLWDVYGPDAREAAGLADTDG
ncbi:MAG: GMC family oxidoreductase [Actinomycetota bacterium]|nr:GMC family oxidoreductase [Actinomycetota bacterium]